MDVHLNRTIALGLALTLAAPAAHASPWRVSAPAVHAAAAAPGAADVDPEAVAAYEAGSRAYALGNYEEAVAGFERAFELSQRSELLFNLGQAYSRWYDISGDVGHLKKARKLLQNYLAFIERQPEGEDPEAESQARERLAEIERQIGDAEAPVNGDDKPIHRKGWFWAVVVGAAALVAGGVTVGVVLGRRRADGFDPELGSIGRAPAPGLPRLRF
jgi:tetratricopeptide (TPR) repeat protein